MYRPGFLNGVQSVCSLLEDTKHVDYDDSQCTTRAL